jgi:hypothetical protein
MVSGVGLIGNDTDAVGGVAGSLDGDKVQR